MADDNLAPENPRPRDRNAEGRPENARPRDRFGAPLPRDAEHELPDRVEPEDVCSTVEEARDRAAELFDEQRFFEAHEFFEWAWKGPATADADRDFFKGMAQLAVGYTHTQRGNRAGAAALLSRGIQHITPFGPRHHGIDVARAVADAEVFLSWVDRGNQGPDGPYPAFPSV